MKIDEYDIKARILPGLLALIPFFILNYYLLHPILGAIWDSILNFKIITDITFLGAAFYLLTQVNRIISKEVFEKIKYASGLNFPTTQILLHNNNYYSPEYKKKIHGKIYSDFKIKIPTAENEKKNEIKSRQLITEAISHIRAIIGKGSLLGQHNTEYGFMRNFTGGNLVAFTASICNMVIFNWFYPNNIAFAISCFMAIIYLLLILISVQMINTVAGNYGTILIQEYMNLDSNLQRRVR